MTRKVASDQHIAMSMDDYPTSPPPPGTVAQRRGGDFDNVTVGLIVATQVVGIAVLVLTLVWTIAFLGGLSVSSEFPDQIFNLHPLCEVFAFVFLFGQAILTYRLLSLPKPTLKLIHTIVNGVALFFAVFGLWAVLKFHALRGIPDFYSLHSWFGLATLILFLAQWLTGLYTFLYPGAAAPTRQMVMPWHTFLGLFIFVLALTTASQGLLEKSIFRFSGGLAKRGAEALMVNFTGILVFLWGALVLLTATKSDKTRLVEGYGVLP